MWIALLALDILVMVRIARLCGPSFFFLTYESN